MRVLKSRRETWISRLNRSALMLSARSVCKTFTTTRRPERRLLGDEHLRHAPAAKLALERVAATETGLQLLAELGRHTGRWVNVGRRPPRL